MNGNFPVDDNSIMVSKRTFPNYIQYGQEISSLGLYESLEVEHLIHKFAHNITFFALNIHLQGDPNLEMH